ncbi:hypothetical protein BDV27DRAFT_151367 [Aspergillus caelatus]|uniref:Fungal-specific transcription factor domain-containing protein n=2 Tax=Aspergillus subgen. Circumdati TaxID=2720871 RepID=A0A5N6ZIA9_9EURO|nr:uncharacterized protein BDV27DRAFT_151367 [Aspergillus caelatus]KAE8357382.1 hypothetical protein BDV27DRAFT_151367 [Aspergillus caelatus]KAE8421737.1 hypothetical protein BDV36DRAFT_304434 [Aspergillus pseudocaelatus]
MEQVQQQVAPSTNEHCEIKQQQPLAFTVFMNNAFPISQAYNKFRETNYPNFAHYITSKFDQSVCLDTSAYSVCLVFQSRADVEASQLNKGRHAYVHALRALQHALNSDQISNKPEMIGTSILLSIYEMRVPSEPHNEWSNHCLGVAALMKEMGAQSFAHGFARSCYIFFRGFLIAVAFHQQQPCFLEEDQWQQLAERIRVEDSQKLGISSIFVDVTERIFMELVKCPRYVYEAQVHQCIQNYQRALVLSSQILGAQNNLRSLVTQLKDLISTYQPGVIPSAPGYLLKGAEDAVHFLGTLARRLIMNPIPPLHVYSGLTWLIDNVYIAYDARWLDEFACSMGFLGTTLVD